MSHDVSIKKKTVVGLSKLNAGGRRGDGAASREKVRWDRRIGRRGGREWRQSTWVSFKGREGRSMWRQ